MCKQSYQMLELERFMVCADEAEVRHGAALRQVDERADGDAAKHCGQCVARAAGAAPILTTPDAPATVPSALSNGHSNGHLSNGASSNGNGAAPQVRQHGTSVLPP